MKPGIDTVDWDDIARAVGLEALDQTVSALARELSAAVRQLSLYDAAPLRSGSSASQGRLSCRWWVVLDPPVTWHCHYEAKQKALHSAQGPSLRLLFQGLAKVDGLQNPIAQAVTLQCLVQLGPEVRRLPELAARRLRSIPGWQESVRVIESFQVAEGLAPGSWPGEVIDDQRGEDEDWDDRYDDYPDVPF